MCIRDSIYRLPIENKHVKDEVIRILNSEKIYSITRKLLNGWGIAKVYSHTVYPLENEYGLFVNNETILSTLASEMEIRR